MALGVCPDAGDAIPERLGRLSVSEGPGLSDHYGTTNMVANLPNGVAVSGARFNAIKTVTCSNASEIALWKPTKKSIK